MESKEACELNENTLEQVNGGMDWEYFGKLVINTVDPAAYPELTAAILAHNTPLVVTLAAPLCKSDPAILRCFMEASLYS